MKLVLSDKTATFYKAPCSKDLSFDSPFSDVSLNSLEPTHEFYIEYKPSARLMTDLLRCANDGELIDVKLIITRNGSITGEYIEGYFYIYSLPSIKLNDDRNAVFKCCGAFTYTVAA